MEIMYLFVRCAQACIHASRYQSSSFLFRVHGIVSAKRDLVHIIKFGTVSAKIAPRLKCYKNASRLNRYNFPMDNAIDFLFSTLHTTPFPYEVLQIGSRFVPNFIICTRSLFAETIPCTLKRNEELWYLLAWMQACAHRTNIRHCLHNFTKYCASHSALAIPF